MFAAGIVAPLGAAARTALLESGTIMKAIRSIFISDTHLGCKYTHADALLAFLQRHEPQYLYIVGDFIDGWRLKRGWYWNDTYTFVLRRIADLMRRGTRVYYTPGNHDEFLRSFINNLGGSSLGSIRLADEFIHCTADKRRMLVTHGDKFDTVIRHARLLSHMGDVGYNLLLGVNVVYNAMRRRFGYGYWSLSAYIKRRVKQATSFIGKFEDVLTKAAADAHCDGVICGHIHTPRHSIVNGVEYYNTGDWVESCTALVEYADGQLEIVHRPWNSAPELVSPSLRRTTMTESSNDTPVLQPVLALSAALREGNWVGEWTSVEEPASSPPAK
jgi:UDP-2,3-diacylglucosamine pyrophosphatase LpxH